MPSSASDDIDVLEKAKRLLAADYVPSEDEEYMNERQQAYFRMLLIEWKRSIHSAAGQTLQSLQDGPIREADLTDDDLFYCFVDFGVPHGAIHVIPAAVVAETIRDDHATWLATPGKNGQLHADTSGRRMRSKTFTKPEGWMDEFLEAWHLLK